MNKQVHNIKPVSDRDSKILILGSFPSVKSREQVFFYAHPQNRFWKILAALFKEEVPENVEDKKEFLHRNHIALWDVIESCTIHGSNDASIKEVKPNDINGLIAETSVHTIVTTGGKAAALFRKYIVTEVRHIALPSTSAANASMRLEQLIKEAIDE